MEHHFPRLSMAFEVTRLNRSIDRWWDDGGRLMIHILIVVMMSHPPGIHGTVRERKRYLFCSLAKLCDTVRCPDTNPPGDDQIGTDAVDPRSNISLILMQGPTPHDSMNVSGL